MEAIVLSAKRLLLLGIACSIALALPQPAEAACHIAAFDSSSQSVQVNENAGQVTLTVELVGGQPQCSGTVDYQTVNGTAVAGQDYTAKQGTLTFTTGDDRKESFSVPIINDTADEPSQSFTVKLSNGTGSFTADETPATVTIADNDPAPQPTSSPATPKATSTPTRPATTSATTPASASPSVSVSPTSSPTAAATSPSPTSSETIQAAPRADSGGSGSGAVFGILAAVVALAGGGFWLWRRRTTG